MSQAADLPGAAVVDAARKPARHFQRLLHPLCGADLTTLLGVLVGSGGIAPQHLPRAGIALAAAIARWPFSTVERVVTAVLRRQSPPMPPPLFIIGHWRSGTTHLYNVLTRSPAFGYVPPIATGLPWDMLGLGRVLRPLLERALPRERFVDSLPVRPDSPQEDEIPLANMQPLSFYHGIYFPRRLEERFRQGVFFDSCGVEAIARWRRRHVLFLEKLALLQRGRRLLIKNPVYSARIALLREIWPEAKFIHIYRNPYRVFASSRTFYAKLLQEFAMQRFERARIDELILETYPRMMGRLLEDAAALPEAAYVEVRFETFVGNPLGELSRLYETLGLEGFVAARPCFEAYLGKVRDHRGARHPLPTEAAFQVRQRWAPFIERLGYAADELDCG
jgi:omega-hydroxy-beta-dihydromenaquinone-9 sulfotransferase